MGRYEEDAIRFWPTGIAEAGWDSQTMVIQDLACIQRHPPPNDNHRDGNILCCGTKTPISLLRQLHPMVSSASSAAVCQHIHHMASTADFRPAGKRARQQARTEGWILMVRGGPSWPFLLDTVFNNRRLSRKTSLTTSMYVSHRSGHDPYSIPATGRLGTKPLTMTI